MESVKWRQFNVLDTLSDTFSEKKNFAKLKKKKKLN